jgi:hypothetical protein
MVPVLLSPIRDDNTAEARDTSGRLQQESHFRIEAAAPLAFSSLFLGAELGK